MIFLGRQLLIFFLILTGVSAAAIAQPAGIRASSSLPFEAGESLKFEGKISKFVSIPVGDMSFEVINGSGPDKLRLRVDAQSRGTLVKLFKFSFVQSIDSSVDPIDLRSFTTTKHDVQKQRVRDSIARFDYDDKKVTWVETDPNAPTKPPRTIASDLNGSTFDIVSGIYFLRTLPLAVGYSTSIAVSDSGLVYQIPIRVAARERQKTIFGDIWCYRVEPVVFGPGRFFEQKGKLEIWLTDDARRIPVRARVNAEVGKLDIRLKSATNLK
jgi:hypothetical protein